MGKLNHDPKIPCNFSMTAACYDPSKPQSQVQLVHRINPQTTEFCAQLGITDINVMLQKDKEERGDVGTDESEEDRSEYSTDTSALSSFNPDEILLDEEEEEEGPGGDVTTPSVEPSSHQASDLSTSFSDVRNLPSSMFVSSDDASHSPTGGEGNPGDTAQSEEEESLTDFPLKRLSNEHEPEQRKKIKRRNQAIYAAVDDADNDE